MRFGILGAEAGIESVLGAVGAVGATGRVLAREDSALVDLDAIILSGAVGSSPAMAAVGRFAAQGGPVLGVGAGFRSLCGEGLLDGAVARADAALAPAQLFCLVEGRPTPFSHAIPAGRHIELSGARVEGCYAHAEVAAVEAESRVVLRYCSADGEVESAANVEGSVNNIAGICNAAGNVVGLLPHPRGTGGWRALLACAVGWGRDRPARV